MRNSILTAFGDHRVVAMGAFSQQAWLSFSTLSFNDSKFHIALLNGQCLLDRARCYEMQAEACQLLLVLASRQRWPEGLCRWLLAAAVAPPYAFSSSTVVRRPRFSQLFVDPEDGAARPS
jgi:hypothetical protein